MPVVNPHGTAPAASALPRIDTWSFLFGGGTMLLVAWFGLLRPAQQHLTGLERQVSQLTRTVSDLNATGNGAKGTNALLAQLQIQGPQRLIHQQHFGGSRDRPGEGDALLLPARNLSRKAIGDVRQLDQLQQLHERGEVDASFHFNDTAFSWSPGRQLFSYPEPVLAMEQQLKLARKAAEGDGTATRRHGRSFWTIKLPGA